MKKLLCTTLSFFLCSLVFTIEVDIPYRSVPDNIASLQIFNVDENENNIPMEKIKYNLRGAKETKHVYDKEGDLKWTVYYEYREDNQISQKRAKDPAGETIWRSTYNYDKEGRITKQTQFNRKNQPDFTEVHEYQKDRKEILAYGSKGSLQWRQRIDTPKDNNKREVYYYYPDGSRIKGIIQEFNPQGNIYKEIHIDEIGTVFRRIETEYDVFGRVNGRIVYNHRGEVHRRVWIEYLPHGHIGMVRQVLPTEGRVEEFTYSYQIDHRGSWTLRHKLTTIIDERMEEPIVRSSTQVRKIEYQAQLLEN